MAAAKIISWLILFPLIKLLPTKYSEELLVYTFNFED